MTVVRAALAAPPAGPTWVDWAITDIAAHDHKLLNRLEDLAQAQLGVR